MVAKSNSIIVGCLIGPIVSSIQKEGFATCLTFSGLKNQTCLSFSDVKTSDFFLLQNTRVFMLFMKHHEKHENPSVLQKKRSDVFQTRTSRKSLL